MAVITFNCSFVGFVSQTIPLLILVLVDIFHKNTCQIHQHHAGTKVVNKLKSNIKLSICEIYLILLDLLHTWIYSSINKD